MIRPNTHISLGFHRLGIALGTPLVLFGLAAGIWELRPIPNCAGLFDNIPPDAIRCRVPEGAMKTKSGLPSPPSEPERPWLIVAVACLAGGMGTYAGSRALGWVVHGFTGSQL